MLLNSAVGPAPPPARAADSGVGSPRSPPPLLHSAQRLGEEGRGGAGRGRVRAGAGRGGVRAAAPGSGRTKYSGAWLFLAGPRARARRVRGRPDPAGSAEGAGVESPSWTRLDPVWWPATLGQARRRGSGWVGVSCGREWGARAVTGAEGESGRGDRHEGWLEGGPGARGPRGVLCCRRVIPVRHGPGLPATRRPRQPRVAWGRSRPRPPLPESRGYPSRTSRRSRGGGGGPGLILHLHHGCSSSCSAPLWLFPLLSNCFVNWKYHDGPVWSPAPDLKESEVVRQKEGDSPSRLRWYLVGGCVEKHLTVSTYYLLPNFSPQEGLKILLFPCCKNFMYSAPYPFPPSIWNRVQDWNHSKG